MKNRILIMPRRRRRVLWCNLTTKDD